MTGERVGEIFPKLILEWSDYVTEQVIQLMYITATQENPSSRHQNLSTSS